MFGTALREVLSQDTQALAWFAALIGWGTSVNLSAFSRERAVTVSRTLPIVLAAILLLGQLGLLVHQLDRDAHHGGDNCQVCLHLSALDGLPSSEPAGFVPVIMGRTGIPSLSPTVREAESPVFSARAPPASLSA